MNEHQIQSSILRALAGDIRVRVWRSNTGKAVSFDGKRVLSFGITGQADISGIIGVDIVSCLPGGAIIFHRGARIEIEVKTPDGVQGEHQKLFEQAITKYGGIYILARSAQDVLDKLDGK